MYKNIIFDIGNVLLNFEPEEYLKTKILESDRISEVREEIFQSKEWSLLDRGTITEEEAKNILISRSRRNGRLIELAFANWYDILTPIEDSIKVLKELKKLDFKIYYLSNFHLLSFKNVNRKYDFFRLFDGGVVSYKEKLIKPEDGIYQRIIDKYKIKPEESIFIDDTVPNIEVAKKFNFNTIHLSNPENLREELALFSIYL